jgi:hypothetical protein
MAVLTLSCPSPLESEHLRTILSAFQAADNPAQWLLADLNKQPGWTYAASSGRPPIIEREHVTVAQPRLSGCLSLASPPQLPGRQGSDVAALFRPLLSKIN